MLGATEQDFQNDPKFRQQNRTEQIETFPASAVSSANTVERYHETVLRNSKLYNQRRKQLEPRGRATSSANTVETYRETVPKNSKLYNQQREPCGRAMSSANTVERYRETVESNQEIKTVQPILEPFGRQQDTMTHL